MYIAFADQFGGGDVKLAVPLGFTLSWYGWATLLTGVLLGWLLAAVWVVARSRIRRWRESLDRPVLDRRRPRQPSAVSGALGERRGDFATEVFSGRRRAP